MIKRTEDKKECSRCRDMKLHSEFGVDKSRVDGYMYWCKVCNNTNKKEFYYENKDKIRITQREYERKRREMDTLYRIKDNLSRRMRKALKGTNISTSILVLLDCLPEELKIYLQKTAIKNGYKDFDIDNYDSKKYHIDHIVPCASFDLSLDEEQRKCFHYTNLQILEAEINIRKSDSILF